MSLHGSGGAYYRSSGTLPAASGMRNAYSRHFWIRSAVASSVSSWKIPAAMTGPGQNPSDQFRWHAGAASYDRSNGHRNSGGSYVEARYPAQLPADTWLGIGVTFDGANTRSFLDGVIAATSSATSPAASGDVYFDLLAAVTYAGSLDSSSNMTDAEVAEYAYWNTALTADEMAALGQGFRASNIRPQNLVFYAPCVRSLVDISGGRTLVKQAGTDVVTDHPRVF